MNPFIASCLLKNTDNKYFSIDEYKEAVKGEQTDKDNKLVLLYATDAQAQYSYIEAAKAKGYDVLMMDCQVDSYFVNLLESKIEDCRIVRVDSDSVTNLIPKEEKINLEMSEQDKTDLDIIFQTVLPEENQYFVQGDNLGEDEAPVLITQSEFMRRYREMSSLGGGMNFYSQMPESYNITVNMQNPLIAKILGQKPATIAPAESASDDKKTEIKDANKTLLQDFAKENEILRQVADLALLSNGLLKGKALSDFIARSQKVAQDAYLK